jgi:hypothetical protein
LIIQARDDDSAKTGKFVSDVVESNAGWKACFPNVVPDKERGWSLNGYYVKDAKADYAEWVQKCTNDHKRDPGFMTASVLAGAIGMHPTGCLVLDDIHDSRNTESMAEMERVKKTVLADIIPTMNRPGRKPIFLVAYTPWKSDDAYAVLEQSGLWRQVVTPAYVEDDSSDVEFMSKRVRLTCPKVYPLVVLEQQYRILGKREFNRQLLCSLDGDNATSLPYYTYVTSGIEYSLPAYGGADPPGAEPDAESKGKKRSNFALAYVVKLPQGGALVLDGVLEECTQTQAENHILNAQSLFTAWNFTLVESVGVGLVFYNSIKRNPNLKILKSDLMETDEKGRRGSQSKDVRILEMAKWFENGTIRIAARDTPFLNALRYLFDHFWELNAKAPHPGWDAADSVYHALKAMPGLFITPAFSSVPVYGQQSKYGLQTPWALGG